MSKSILEAIFKGDLITWEQKALTTEKLQELRGKMQKEREYFMENSQLSVSKEYRIMLDTAGDLQEKVNALLGDDGNEAIPGTDLFVWVNLSCNHIRNIIRKMLKKYGYKRDDF